MNFYYLIIVFLLSTPNYCYNNNLHYHHHHLNNNLDRSKRQEDSEAIGEDEIDSIIGQPCDFGTGKFINPCQWSVPNNSHPMFRWRIAQGSQQFWFGGPEKDHTLLDTSGGYAYFETSYQQQINNNKYSSSIGLNNHQRQSSNNNTIISSGSLLNYSTRKSKNNDEVIRPLINQFPLFQLSKPESKKPIPIPDYGLFQSPNISETGPIGLCMTFYYNIDGLSSDSLQVIISDSKTKYNRTLLEFNDITDGEWKKSEILYTYADLHQIYFRANAKKLNDPDRSFRGYIAIDDPEFKQLDPKTMKKEEESCKGHCTFEASLCSWTNQEEDDDFDWKIGRGSQNLFTGPPRDFSSFDNNEISGGYVYIDSNYPRRPGDRALLLSPIMNPTNDNIPLCLKFAIHMYGNGVGTLRVLIRYTSTSEEQTIPDQLLWEMTGESGNRWHVAQVPISSPVLSYQIVFEGEIGSNNLGVIALDNISFNEEECPVLPQTASKGNGDCTFDENMCLWNNPYQYMNKVDDFDWLRQFSLGQTEPRYDHTKRSADGYFINLNGDQPHRGGTRAWLYSPEFVPQSTVPKCMTFYYYMFERTIDSAGPSLGSLRIYVKTITDMGEEMSLIWRLNNHQGQRWKKAKVPILIGQDKQPPLQNYQIIIEGIWGDGRVGAIAVDDISFYNGNCSIFPTKAAAVFGECAFDHDLCGYRNQSGKAPTTSSVIPGKQALERNKNPNRLSVSKDSITWKLATSTNRPANLQDHTFRAPIGYAYFDVFNQNQVQYPILRSPEFQPREDIPRCVSFWFTPFGRGDSTVLSVYVITMDQKDANVISEDGENDKPNKSAQQNGQQQSGLETKTLVWRITTRKLDSVKPEWIYAQVSVQSELIYRIQFEGEAMDGGFALDDITYYEGGCRTRPIEAAVAPPPESSDAELRE